MQPQAINENYNIIYTNSKAPNGLMSNPGRDMYAFESSVNKPVSYQSKFGKDIKSRSGSRGNARKNAMIPAE